MTVTHDHRHSAGGHAGHNHGVIDGADRCWLMIALALIAVFMVGEVVVGVLVHSLALISDAAHMLTDAASIVLALIAMRLAAQPPSGSYTYGLKRAEILSAQANGLTLLALSAWLTYEAIRRLLDPPAVTASPVLVTALIGVTVNLAAARSISKANRSSMNVEGAFQHILTDLAGFIATAIAGAVMLATGFTRADAIASLIVVVLMVEAGINLVGESGKIFLEAAPPGIVPDTLGATLAAQPNVVEIHDLHIWQIASDHPALSAHVLVAPGQDCHAVRADMQALLARDYAITHTTLQVDHAPAETLTITRNGQDRDPTHCTNP